MEIERTSAARPQPIPPVTPAAPPPAESEARLDRIELSPAAREIGTDPEAAREAALAALRAQIDAGTYAVDAGGVARRIVARGDL